MALKILGKGSFGTDADQEMAQSATKTQSATETLAQNKDGDVVGVALSALTTEKSIEVLVTDGTALPAIGDAFEGGYVTNVSESSGNTQFRRATVTVKTWDEVKPA